MNHPTPVTLKIRHFSLVDDLTLCTEAEQAASLEVKTQTSPKGTKVRAALDRIAKRMAAGTYWGLTATEERVPVGIILIDAEGPAAFVDNLYVVPGRRRQGIGRRLVLQALERLKQEKVGDIELVVTASNEGALQLYRALGFEVSRFRMRKTLERESSGIRGMEVETTARRIRETSKLRGSFTLRSGRVSDTYFDKYLFESDPQLLSSIAQLMAPLIPGDTEILCGLEMGGIPVVTMLSQVTGLPAAFVRKTPKTHGTCKYAEGPSLAGRRIVLVEDVVSSGGAILDTAAMLRTDGVEVNLAICVIDRQTGGLEALASQGIELRCVFTMEQIERAA